MDNTQPQKKIFIVLIGGPGLRVACDREHDQTWKDYLVPIQLATKGQVKLEPNEEMQWWVYGPAYRERWDDDKRAWFPTKAQKEDVANVASKNYGDYLGRIRSIAGGLKVAKVVVLERPATDSFRHELAKLPDQSVNRLWYIGHAAPNGLILKLGHEGCRPITLERGDWIHVQSLSAIGHSLGKKFIAGGDPSKFYGCFTAAFAEQFHSVFHVTAQGATKKIDFGVINRETGIKEILPRLEHSKPDTGWREFKDRPQ